MSQIWSEQDIRRVIQKGESSFVEFKRQWYDFQKNEQKAEFARDMLALVNTATLEERGLLLIGVSDDGTVVPNSAPVPTSEAIAQILSVYTMPPVGFSRSQVAVSGVAIDVLEISPSRHRPHWANRDAGSLKRDVVYVRRGPTIGTLTLPEIAAMIQESGSTVSADLLELGFIEYINWNSGHMTARVANLTEESVGGIYLTMEIASRLKPQLFRRRTLLVDATLQPRESREIKIEVVNVIMAMAERGTLGPSTKLDDRWVDVTLLLVHRDRSGYLRTKSETLRLGD